MVTEKVRICVIGAGPSGVTTLRALQSLAESKYELVCYERYDSIGGIWNFTGKEGLDEDGKEVHSGMYYDLITNGPKECLELPELLFPDNDSKLTGYPCFPDRQYILNYLSGFAEKFGLLKYIKFKRWVDLVTYEEQSKKFKVTVENLESGDVEKSDQLFDYVIVATGHFNYPNYVSYPGQESFPGLVIHSKQFLDAKRYAAKKVLVVGASYSAEDIAIKCWSAKAAHVTISYRTKPTGLKFPEGIDERPIIEKIDGDVVKFVDGTSNNYDVIIYCTGYLHSFPFMEEKLRLNTSNRMAPPLYTQIVYPDNPSVFYIGMQDQYYTFTMFWLHGHFCARVISGDIKIPSKEEMTAEIEKTQKEEAELKDCFDAINFQTKHVNEVAELTNQMKVDATELFNRWEQDRDTDILTYKQQTHFNSIFK